MAWANLQNTGTFSNVAGTALGPLAYGSNVQAGTRLVAVCVWIGTGVGSTTCSLTDSLGNTWSPVAGSLATNGTAVARSQIFHAPSGSAGANSVTMTTSASMAERVLIIAEFSGLSGSLGTTPLAATGSAANPSANLTVDDINSLIVGGCFTGGSATQGTGYSLFSAQDGNVGEYRLPAGTGAQAVSFTEAAVNQYTISGVEFLASAGAAPTVAPPGLAPMLPRRLGPSVFRPLFFKGVTGPRIIGLNILNLDEIVTAETVDAVTLQDQMNLTGIATGESVPALKLTDTINLGGIASAEVVPTLNLQDRITLVGIATGEAVGALKLTDTINLTGIASAENVPPVTTGATDTVNLTDIATAEAFSSLLLQDRMSLGGIASAEAFSALNLQDRISLVGIPTAENVPTVFQSAIGLVGIPSSESVPGVSLTTPGAAGSDGQRQRRGYGT